jgi:hypothetical protein
MYANSSFIRALPAMMHGRWYSNHVQLMPQSSQCFFDNPSNFQKKSGLSNALVSMLFSYSLQATVNLAPGLDKASHFVID